MARATLTSAALEAPPGLEIHLQDVRPDEPLEALRRGSALISDRVGIVKAVGHGIYRAQDPEIFSLGIVASDLSRFTSIQNPGKAGGGGESLEVALAATIGEAVERYCMLFFDKREMPFSSYRDLGELQRYAVRPEVARLFSKEQVERMVPAGRITYFDENAPIYWKWGWSLTAGEPRLVPPSLIYIDYRCSKGEARIGANASSGLAAGLTIESAILSGLYEVIERDAFTMGWMHEWTRNRVEVDVPELQSKIQSGFTDPSQANSFGIFEVTLDIPVTCLFAVSRRRAEWGPALCVSSVARLDPREAVRKCLRELGQGLPYLRYLLVQLADWQPREDHTDLVTFDHHYLLYNRRPDLVDDALAYLWAGDRQVELSAMPNRSTGSIKGDVLHCVEALEAVGIEVIVVDITTPEIKDLGFRVVRVVAPGLLPMHGNHNQPYLGVRRLFDVPWKLGWDRNGWEPTRGLNQRPHPFP